MKDATIEIIQEIIPHPDADRLEICQVLGYNCITQKGLHSEGDKIVYIRTDAVLPEEEWSESYRKYSPNRIKAVKLRGVWSEGIILPLKESPIDLSKYAVGFDVSKMLKITHFEPPIPDDINAKSSVLPYQIPSTDEERVENLNESFIPFGKKVDVTLKVDGQSCSYYYNHKTKEFGVLGRKQELKEDLENKYTYHIKDQNIKEKLIGFCEKNQLSLVLRGESYGKGIQANKYNPHSQKNNSWAMFSVYDIEKRKYYHKGEKFYYRNVAKELNLEEVELLEEDVELTRDLIHKYSKHLTKLNGKNFEGVVIKYFDGSFKVLNKIYDSKK